MFTKVAVALLAATMFSAPVLAQGTEHAIPVALPQPAQRPLTVLRHSGIESSRPGAVCQELEQIVWAARSLS